MYIVRVEYICVAGLQLHAHLPEVVQQVELLKVVDKEPSARE